MAVPVKIREGLEVMIAPLTTRESIQADGIIGSLLGDNPSTGGLALLTTKVYTICAVRAIADAEGNFQPMQPLSGSVGFDTVCSKFSLADLTKLMVAYDDLYGVKVADLKNEPAAEESPK